MPRFSLNKLFLVGFITQKPVVRYLPSGTPVANFPIGVYRGIVSEDGKEYVDYLNVVVWKDLALFCGEHLKKGDWVFVEGRLQVRSYEDSSGQKRKTWEVIAVEIRRFVEGDFVEKTPKVEGEDLELS
ncbi:MAG: single-stranded DNA-binding protein [Candidatus Caldatribacteriaceae bacterium]